MRLRHGLLGICAAITLLLSACPSGDDDDSGGVTNLTAGQSGSGSQAGKGAAGDDGDDNGGSAGSGSGSTGGGGKRPYCNMDDDCGISQECLACGLTDSEGWCFFTKPCNFDDDCKVGEKCGYNVFSSEYRCLPAATCESEE